MWKPSRQILFAFALACVAGMFLRPIYRLFPNPVTAIFSPVNESVWEHLKLIFWPYLVSALVITRGTKRAGRTPWALSLLIGCTLSLGGSGLYHIVIGGESLVFDLVLYLAAMAVCFLLPSLLWKLSLVRWCELSLLLFAALAICIVLFSFLPPEHVLFCDFAAIRTWSTIPY